MQATLVRKTFIDPTNELGKLAQDAAKELGYNVLAEQSRTAGPLGEALQKLDIHPFDKDAVMKYKLEARKTEAAKQYHLQRSGQEKYRYNSKLRVAWGWVSKKEVLPEEEPYYDYYAENLRISWEVIPLPGYTKPIPEFVLRKALDLRRACPDVALFVDELQVNRRPHDPFLIAKLGDEQYYIEVWEESKFESELLK